MVWWLSSGHCVTWVGWHLISSLKPVVTTWLLLYHNHVSNVDLIRCVVSMHTAFLSHPIVVFLCLDTFMQTSGWGRPLSAVRRANQIDWAPSPMWYVSLSFGNLQNKMNCSGCVCVCIRGVEAYLILLQMRCLHTSHSARIRKNIQKIPVTSVLCWKMCYAGHRTFHSFLVWSCVQVNTLLTDNEI